MMKFFIAPVLVVATCTIALLAFGKSEVAVVANASDQLVSSPISQVYAVTAASEVSWQPSFDANPNAIHDMSLHTDK